MGTSEFHRRVFDKVFGEDISRLRSMEEMWQTRRKPDPLDFNQIQDESASIDATISNSDQKVWTLAEDFVVFKDRYVGAVQPIGYSN